MSRITHAQFSVQAAYMASEVASWAADVMTLPEERDQEMREWSLERFTSKIRERLARIEQWDNPAPTPPGEPE